jgi:hypothetical protein
MERVQSVLLQWGAAAVFASLACACSKAADSDGDTEIDTSDHTFDLAGPCDPSELVGSFYVGSMDTGAAQYAVVSGSIADSVNWNTTGEYVGSEGGCTVFEFSTWTCDPACTGGQICNDESTCVAAPLNLDYGTVTVTGLTSAVSMEPDTSFKYQFQDLDNPPFAAGQQILLSAEGAEGTEPLLLDGVGVTPIEVPSADIVLEDATDMQVTWTPSNDAEGEIFGQFFIDQHGASKRWIYCAWDDTGSATVPASLTSLLCDDWTGLPSFAQAYLYRRTVDSIATADGCAEFRVQSQKALNLTFDCPQPE